MEPKIKIVIQKFASNPDHNGNREHAAIIFNTMTGRSASFQMNNSSHVYEIERSLYKPLGIEFDNILYMPVQNRKIREFNTLTRSWAFIPYGCEDVYQAITNQWEGKK